MFKHICLTHRGDPNTYSQFQSVERRVMVITSSPHYTDLQKQSFQVQFVTNQGYVEFLRDVSYPSEVDTISVFYVLSTEQVFVC